MQDVVENIHELLKEEVVAHVVAVVAVDVGVVVLVVELGLNVGDDVRLHLVNASQHQPRQRITGMVAGQVPVVLFDHQDAGPG